MSGTKAGGLKAEKTNKSRYGEDFYVNIGRLGGSVGTTGGFYADRELARTAGAKGGRISKRTKKVVTADISNSDKISSYEKLDSEPNLRIK